MYLLKHICSGISPVIDQLIVTLVLNTSACLVSSTTSGASTACKNGQVNTNLIYSNIDHYNASAGIPNEEQRQYV